MLLQFQLLICQLIANYLNIKAESFEIIEAGKTLSPSPPMSTHVLPCLIEIFSSHYLITFIKGDLPVTNLKNKYEASFFSD